MKGFDTLKIKSAVRQHNKMDLSNDHLTTLDFGQIMPLWRRETIPGDEFKVNGNYFSRLAPLVKPVYGKFKFKTVAVYVPYHMIAYDADAWLTGKTTWEGQTPVQRTFTIATLATFLINYCCTTTGATATNSQFTTIESDGTTEYHLFTKAGKYYVKILCALGYTVPAGVDYQTGSNWVTNIGTKKLSAYPLLAFCKAYNDYMSQSQRFNTSQLSNLLNNIKYGKNVSTQYTASSGQITEIGLSTLLSSILLNYENDYFTSAWQNANNALSATENLTTVRVPEQASIVAATNNYQNTQLGIVNNILSQRMLDFLKSFDNWVRRNNYSGSRAVQQVYSRFGIKTSDYKDHYAHVISTDTMPVQVGDVTAMADAGAQVLGAYAGKGIMSGSKGMSCKCEDYGLLMILGYFTVNPMNPYGFDRMVLRNAPLDYYSPEFDGLGADAISVGEYFGNPTLAGSNTPDDATFGFTERYNAYRYGRDQITGDFRDLRANAGMNVWHLGRDMTAIREASSLVAQGSQVNTMPQYDSEYNRIFNVVNSDVDHFYLTCHFEVDAIRPMLSLNQVPQLGEGNTVVPRNGNVIS